MRYINTSEDSITFIDVDGKQLIVPKNRVYTHFNVDTVTFLLIERYDNEGICLFSTKASDLQINGETYTYQELLDGEGISDLFSPTGLSFEVVEELPQSGEEGTIYLVPNDNDTYTEYIWIAEEEEWEAIGDSDIDLSNYYTKTESDARYATQTVVNDEIAARISGDNTLTTALGTKADKSDTYTKTQVDTALALKQDASTAFSGDYDDLTNKPDLSVYAESADLATVATSGDYDDLSNKPTIPVVPTNVSAFTNDAGYLTQHQSLANYYTKSEVDAELADKQDTLTAGTGITIDANNVISATGGGGDYVDVPTFNQKETAIAQALTDLNENKADKTELPDTSTFATKTELNGKQDTLTAGQNITIQNNVISATGGGGASYQYYSETDEEQENGTIINRHKSGIIEITDEGGTIDSGMGTSYNEKEEDGSISYTEVSSLMYADKDDGETVNGATIAVNYNYASITVSEEGEDNGTQYSKITDFIVNPDSLTVEVSGGGVTTQLELNDSGLSINGDNVLTENDAYTKTQVDTALNGKQDTLTAGIGITIDANNVISASELFAGASYDSVAKHIDFYNDNDDLISYIDATAFIKDGMVDTVAIQNGNLVITFNTDAGKQPISIPLTDIFNPNNYYNKTEIDTMIGNIQTILATI